MIKLKNVNKHLYLELKQQLLGLYIQTFSEGISAQYISKVTAESYLDVLFDEGYGIFGISEKKLVAALLVCPLSIDKERPEYIQKNYNDADSLYIAEVLVAKPHRGNGMGIALLKKFEMNLSHKIKHVFLRVYTENTPAIQLYEKFGYTVCGSLIQTKFKPISKEAFTMHKQYMIKTY